MARRLPHLTVRYERLARSSFEQRGGDFMDRIRRNDLELLLAPQTGPCVSLYMPTHVKDKNAQDDPTCLRDLCDQAEQTLVDRGMRRPDVLKLLEPIRALPTENLAWQHRG